MTEKKTSFADIVLHKRVFSVTCMGVGRIFSGGGALGDFSRGSHKDFTWGRSIVVKFHFTNSETKRKNFSTDTQRAISNSHNKISKSGGKKIEIQNPAKGLGPSAPSDAHGSLH